MYVTCDIDVYDMTHSRISLMYVTWLNHTRWCRWDLSFMYTFMYVTFKSMMYVTYYSLFMTWCIDVCDIDGLNIWYESLIYVTWLVHTHWCMWQYSFIYMKWRIDVCDMTHPCTLHVALIYVRWLVQYVTWDEGNSSVSNTHTRLWGPRCTDSLSLSNTHAHIWTPETKSADQVSSPLLHDQCVPVARQIHTSTHTYTRKHKHAHTLTHTNWHTHTRTHQCLIESGFQTKR